MTTKKTTTTSSSARKVTASYTTSSGQKVTKYSDGTKSYSGGGSSGASSSATKAPTPAQKKSPTQADLYAQLGVAQKMLTAKTGMTQATFDARKNAPGVITPATLAPTPPVAVTQPSPATQMTGLGASLEAKNATFAEELKTTATGAETTAKSALADYIAGLKATQGETALTDAEYKKTGVDTAEQEYKDISNQILEEQVSLRRQLEALDKNPQGLFGGALQQEKDKVERASISKQADLAVIQLAKMGRYDSAKAIADRAVQAKLEVQKNLNEALKVNYEANKDIFSTAEKRAFEVMLSDRERGLDMEAYKEKTRFDQIIEQSDPLYKAQLKKAQNDANGTSGLPGEQLYSGLSSASATAIRSKVGKFSSEPLVQSFATVQEGNNFAQTIDNNSQNPAEHQALIYALAKALDPGSVVREGEYATAQKYAQSWVSAYGKGVEQAIAGTGFLSSSAISNIKSVIAQKYEASRKSYENLERSYTTNINDLTGRDDGDKFLADYSTPIVDAKSATEELDAIVGTPPKEEKGFFKSFLSVFGL